MKLACVAMALALGMSSAAPACAEARETPAQAEAQERRQRAGEIMRQMLPPESVAAMENSAPSTRFGGEFARLAYENAYVSLWTRPGLSPKERSLLTIGILIGLRDTQELEHHVAAGLRNGLTRAQIEEIIYHSTAYAGFPAAASALTIAGKAVDQEHK